MSKIDELTPINASYTGITKLNAHLDKIEAALQNTVSRDGSAPNFMEADLDMNDNQLINLATPTTGGNAATKTYVDEALERLEELIVGGEGAALEVVLDRANHTGVQAISTVAGLQTELDSKANASSLASYVTIADATAAYQPLRAVLTNTTASFLVADETKLDGIEALADVTDAANVNAAGALMHSDLVSNGFIGRTAAETYVSRTITGTGSEITVTNGDGAAGNPTLSLPASLNFAGKTVSGGTFSGPNLTGTVTGAPVFASQLFSNVGFRVDSTAPYYQIKETDAPADETTWRIATIAGNLYLYAYLDDLSSASAPLLITRTGTVIDKITLTGTELEFNGTTLDVNAAMDISGALTNGSNYTLSNWTAANTDIDGLITGSTFGMILEGAASGHTVVGIRDNDGGDTFSVISGYDGVNFWTTDSLYKRLCFQVSAAGNAYVNGTLDLGHATQNTLSASGGVLSIEGVAIPTISSTSTLTNKTISGGTVSGTLAGAPTLPGVWTFSASPVVPTPSAATDAANKAYVDSVATGLKVLASAATATTANITLSGEQTIDGVLTSASRVLVKNQTLSQNNGVYVSAAGAWSRATDMNDWTETVGALVSVTGGSTNANKVFASTTASGGTLGTTAITFAEFINTSGLQPLDSDLTSIAALATTAYGRSLLEAENAAALRTLAGTVIGTDVQAYSAALAATTASFTSADETKLDGIEAGADVTDATNVNIAGAVMHTDLTTNGMLTRTGSETYVSRSIVQPAAGISVSNGDGVAGNPTLALTNDLSALEALTTTGITIRSATDTWLHRAVTGTTGEITVTNGDGVAGAPTISLPATVVVTGKQLNNGTYSNPTLSGTVAGSPTFNGDPTFSGNPVFSANPNFTGAPTFGAISASSLVTTGVINVGNASDTTLSRKSAGVLQVEAFQLATVGPKVFYTSQYCVGDGTTNDYTAFNNLHTTASSAGGTIIVDGLIRLSTSMTTTVPIIVQGGGFTVDSTRVLTINGNFVAGRSQVFQGVGTVTWNAVQKEIYPEWWGVKSSVVSGYSSSSNLTAVNAMHASVTAGTYGVEVHWANKQYFFSGAWTAITRNNIKHVGAGGATLGTWFLFENTTGNDVTFSNCQHAVVENIAFWPSTSKKTSGYLLRFTGCYRARVQNCYFAYGFSAVEISDCTETVVFNSEFRYLLGTRAINYTGTGIGPLGSYRVYVNNIVTNNPWPVVSNPLPSHVRGNWAISTAYGGGDIVQANGKVWQCLTAGTSAGAGSGPSAIPGANAADAFTTSVADGTAAWYFVMDNELTWFCQDNYAYSASVKHCGLINGAYALRQIDTANTGSSYPIWLWVSGTDTDHTLYGGVVATRGESVLLSDMWLGSALNGHGVRMASTHRGELSVTNSRIMGNSASGVYSEAPGLIITGNQIGKNSTASSGTQHGVHIAANVNRFVVGNNIIGGLVGGGTEGQGYGVFVAAGTSNNYTITNNVCNGNVTGVVSDGGTGVTKTVSGNVA